VAAVQTVVESKLIDLNSAGKAQAR
jgi:hypothetical protein